MLAAKARWKVLVAPTAAPTAASFAARRRGAEHGTAPPSECSCPSPPHHPPIAKFGIASPISPVKSNFTRAKQIVMDSPHPSSPTTGCPASPPRHLRAPGSRSTASTNARNSRHDAKRWRSHRRGCRGSCQTPSRTGDGTRRLGSSRTAPTRFAGNRPRVALTRVGAIRESPNAGAGGLRRSGGSRTAPTRIRRNRPRVALDGEKSTHRRLDALD
jgi:hypothetical protein